VGDPRRSIDGLAANITHTHPEMGAPVSRQQWFDVFNSSAE
jgi:hypothetical protein